MPSKQNVIELMETAGFDKSGQLTAAPYLNTAEDPALLIDVLMGFGMQPHAMWRVVKALEDLANATGQPCKIIGQELLEVGPYAALLGIDLESATTAVLVLWKAGSRNPGIALRNALFEAAGGAIETAQGGPNAQPR